MRCRLEMTKRPRRELGGLGVEGGHGGVKLGRYRAKEKDGAPLCEHSKEISFLGDSEICPSWRQKKRRRLKK